jgi:hypothetical protein
MPSYFDDRGVLIYPADALIPDELRQRIADEVDPARLRVEQAADAIDVAKRAVPQSKVRDAAALKDAIAAGKEPPRIIDKFEREALADVARAKAVHSASVKVLADIERPVIRAIREAMPSAEVMGAQRATELGERYLATLKEALRLRREYGESLEDWRAIIGELDRQRHAAEHPDRAGNLAEIRPSWRPLTGENIANHGLSAAQMLSDIIAGDARRHVKPPPKPPSDQDKRHSEEFAAIVSAGGRGTKVYLPS